MSNKPKVLIQIFMTQDNRVGVVSDSTNHVTNLGLIGIAQSMFQKQVDAKDPSPIIQPEMA